LSDRDPNQSDAGSRVRIGADMPQRYLVNHDRYAARGGLIRLPEDMRGFIAAENNKSDMARFYFFCLAFDQIVKEGLKGDFAELGVYKGHTASLLALMARRLGSTVYLLDTFTGFSDADLKGIDANVRMGFDDTSIEAVRALVGVENVRFVPGYFPESAAGLPADAVYSLVHLDCDLYAPMASALAYFYPRLVPGGFLIIHDYSSLHWGGVERAVDEFFATKAEAVISLPDSAGSAVIRKAATPSRYDNWYMRRSAELLGPEWTQAGAGKLAPLLGDGWSGPESWGVWGVDDMHQFFVFLAAAPTRDIELEFDVSAWLFPADAPRVVEVFVGGQKSEDWIFTHDRNRAARSVRIPVGYLLELNDTRPIMQLDFKPALVITEAELSARGGDKRRLGVSLHAARRTS
jgi:hypothetical protein